MMDMLLNYMGGTFSQLYHIIFMLTLYISQLYQLYLNRAELLKK